MADNLTTTEFAAAMLAAREWTNQEIAAHMKISPNTVKRHPLPGYEKAGCRTAAGAEAVYAPVKMPGDMTRFTP